MRAVGRYRARLAFFQRSRRIGKGAGGIYHVIDDDAVASFDAVADDVHDFRFVRPRAAFVDDGQFGINLFGGSAGAQNTANIRRYYHRIFEILCQQVI